MSDRTTEPLWTLAELTRRVELALANGYAGAPSGRVRDVPDLRTIRYYTTLGLVDRPARMDGRTALYGRRHLAQIVAIKRLQASGASLAAVQARLGAIAPGALAKVAELPDAALEPGSAPTTPSVRPSAKRRSKPFWSARPARSSAASAQPRDAGAPAHAPTWQAVALDPRTLLVCCVERPLAAEDVSSLTDAAKPVLETLHARGLLASRDERENP